MYQRILVPVDGSDTSTLALQEVLKLATEQHISLRIVHVVDEINLNLEPSYAMETFLEAVRKSGEEILKKAETLARKVGVTAETKMLEIETFGHRIADVIVEEARSWPADLIVIGTHGRRGFSHLFLGSVAEGVVRLAPIPVLLIRSQ